MKRVLLLILGAVLVVLGLFLSLVGGTLAAIVGPSGTVTTDVGKVSGGGYALVFNEFTVNTIINVDAVDSMGEFQVQAKSTTPNQLFIGIGPTAKVNDYLTGSARDIVSDVTGGSSRVVPIPGPKVPANPDTQTFWIVQDQGVRPSVPLKATGPDTSLVIMNVVPAKPVGANVYLGMTSSSLFPVGIGVLIVGVLFLVVGVFVLIRALRGKRGSTQQVPPPTGQSPVAQYAAPQATPPAPTTNLPPPPNPQQPPTSPPAPPQPPVPPGQ